MSMTFFYRKISLTRKLSVDGHLKNVNNSNKRNKIAKDLSVNFNENFTTDGFLRTQCIKSFFVSFLTYFAAHAIINN